MKNVLCTVGLSLTILFLSSCHSVEEGHRKDFKNPGGMWMPHQLAEQTETLESLGVDNPTALSDPLSHPLGAIVWMGGCSASFVSADGLIITNHHCANSSLQFHSTPESNLFDDGFLAHSCADELPGETGKKVWVTQEMTDVTDIICKGLEEITSPLARHDEVEMRIKQMIAQHESESEDIRCEIKQYYQGSQYYLIKFLELKDVRLVYAPAGGVGFFGGLVDNWHWPRQTGDFTFFRAYTGPDGKPAEYSVNNIPYKPKYYLRMASEPLQSSDFVMVAGYPGRTQRWQTAEQIRFAVEEDNPRRIRILSEVSKIYKDLAAQSEDLNIKVEPSIRGVMNYLQLLELMQDNVAQNDLLTEKKRQQDQLQNWIDSDPQRRQRWGDLLDEISVVNDELQATAAGDYLLSCVTGYVRMLNSAHTILRMAEERVKPDAERDPGYQQRNWDRIIQGQRRSQKSYDPIIDKAVLEFYIERIGDLGDDQNANILNAFELEKSLSAEEFETYFETLFNESLIIDDPDVREDLLKHAEMEDLRNNDDPFIQLALKLRPLTKEMEDRRKVHEGRMMLLSPAYVQARQAFYGRPVAPDANGTLRVTYGTVRGYRPTPQAEMYVPFTTLSSLVDKHTGQEPFNAPAELLKAAKNVTPDSPFYHAEINDIPVDFLSDLDITGGNSGSATLNRKGELVGLVFDGNSESLASNLLFMPEITRSIHVDIRYVLWVMKHVDKADNLLKELGCSEAWVTESKILNTFRIKTFRYSSGDGKIQIENNGKSVYEQEGHAFYIENNNFIESTDIIPIGSDITGNGKPNLVYYEWSGGAHCCFTATILELSKTIKKIAVIEGNHSQPLFEDLNDDGIYEVSLEDWTYEYWPQSFASSPRPEVILKWKDGQYVVAPEYMISSPPEKESFNREIKLINGTDFTYPAGIMSYAIDLMYDGHEQLGWNYIDKAWPDNDLQRKIELIAELKTLMNQSPYWSSFKKQLHP